jgi:predicted RNA-binding Zn ribbon-like protein
MARTNAKEDLIWKDGFLFVGNDPALDFLNTRPVQDGEPTELLPDFAAVVRWLHAAGLLSSYDLAALTQRWDQSAAARRTVEAIRALREMLRKEVLAWEKWTAVHRSTIDEINRLMAEHPMFSRLKKNGNELSAEVYFKPQRPEDLLAPLAYNAAILFASAKRDRVRKCNQCVLHFVDTSKKGTRRWCSMQLCGNRLKVAAYAARQRSAGIKT